MSESNTAVLEDGTKVSGVEGVSVVSQESDGTPVFINLKKNDNALLLPVDMLDPEHFRNPREHKDPEAVITMMASLKRNGQLQAIGGKQLDTGKIAIVCGWTRTEAFWRNVTTPLIIKWNSENKIERVNQLMPANKAHREMVCKAYPEDFNAEKMKPKNLVAVTLLSAATAAEAYRKAVEENTERTQMCVLDLTNSAVHMLTELEMKPKEVAGTMGVSASQISVFKKVHRLTTDLVSILVTPEPGESFVESDLVKMKESVKVICQVLVNRMKLPSEHAVCIPISTLKILANNAWMRDADEAPGVDRIINRKQLLELVCMLVGADAKTLRVTGYSNTDDKPNLNGSVPPPALGVFTNACKNAEEIAKRVKSGKSVEVEAATEEGLAAKAAAEVAGSAATGTVEGLAAAQKAANASPTLPDPTLPPKTYAELKAEEASGKVKIDGATEAAAANADVTVGSSKAASILGVDASSVANLDDDVEPGVSDSTNRKVQKAPLENIKVKEPNIILSRIQACVDLATAEEEEGDDGKNMGVVAACLGAISMGYEMLGMKKECSKAASIEQVYCGDMNTYVSIMEEYVEELYGEFVKLGGKRTVMKPFDLERPTVTKFQIQGPMDDLPDGEDGDGDDEEDEELSGDDDDHDDPDMPDDLEDGFGDDVEDGEDADL